MREESNMKKSATDMNLEAKASLNAEYIHSNKAITRGIYTIN